MSHPVCPRRVTQDTTQGSGVMKGPDQKLGHNIVGYPDAFEAQGNGTIRQKMEGFQEAAKN